MATEGTLTGTEAGKERRNSRLRLLMSTILSRPRWTKALGPILKWRSSPADAEERVREPTTFSYPRMDDCEAPSWAGLRLALDQSTQPHAGKLQPKEAMVRGHRIALLSSACAPLRRKQHSWS